MVDGVTTIVFDKAHLCEPESDDKIYDQHRMFLNERVITEELPRSMYHHRGCSEDVQTFFMELMLHPVLIYHYAWYQMRSYLAPAFFVSSFRDSSRNEEEERGFNGPFCVVHFEVISVGLERKSTARRRGIYPPGSSNG